MSVCQQLLMLIAVCPQSGCRVNALVYMSERFRVSVCVLQSGCRVNALVYLSDKDKGECLCAHSRMQGEYFGVG